MEGEGSGEKRPKKFQEGWKPTRGGKKAKKQQVRAEAFVAKQEAAKASGGNPEDFVVVSVAEAEFPDFRPEDRITGAPSSSSRPVPVSAPVTPPKALAKVPAPSVVVPIPKPPSLPVSIPVPIPGHRTPPKNPSPVTPPKESSVGALVPESSLEREARINKAIETAPWRRVEVVPKVEPKVVSKPATTSEFPKEVSSSSSSIPLVPEVSPKALPKVSETIVDLTGFNPPISTVPTIPGPKREIRLSVDWNGVCNVGNPGDRERNNELHPSAREAIRNALLGDHRIRVGVCSYIGLGGDLSRERRISLNEQIFRLNQELLREGIVEQDRLVTLCISARDKPEIRSEVVSAHLDDRWDICQKVKERNVVPVHFVHHRYKTENFPSVESVGEYFTRVLTLTFPREFRVPFYDLPVDPAQYQPFGKGEGKGKGKNK